MFLVCGEALFDVFLPATHTSGGSMQFDAMPGGSPLNVAVGLARLGTRTAFFAGVSRDLLGEHLMSVLAGEGIDLRFVVRKPERTTLSLIGSSPAGSPAYTFYGDRSADVSLSEADMPALSPDIIGIHLGSYAIAVSPVADVLAKLARRELHRLIVLDPNVRLTIEPDRSLWVRRIEQLLPSVSVLKASAEDLELLWPGKSLTELASVWLTRGPLLVVVTQGSNGATAFHAAGTVHSPAQPVSVVDTVGAGDAFQSALIDSLLALDMQTRADIGKLSRGDIKAILNRSIQSSALTCGRRGADPPTRNQLGAFDVAGGRIARACPD